MTDDSAVAFMPLARYVAVHIAWLPEHQDDLVQEGMIALINAFRGRDTPPDNPSGYAYTVLRRAMQDWYSVHDRKDRFVQPPDEFDLLPVAVAVTGLEVHLESVFFEEYFRAVRSFLSPRHEAVAKELVDPGEGVRWFIERDMLEQSQRYKPGSGKRRPTARLKQEYIRKHLRIREEEWPDCLRELKQFTESWIASPSEALPSSAA